VATTPARQATSAASVWVPQSHTAVDVLDRVGASRSGDGKFLSRCCEVTVSVDRRPLFSDEGGAATGRDKRWPDPGGGCSVTIATRGVHAGQDNDQRWS
jgi:hypothetical protein